MPFLWQVQGIGAGILVDEKILRGVNDIAGAVGWMALEKPFQQEYSECGCFESASGDGIAKLTRKFLLTTDDYTGILNIKPVNAITAVDVFDAYNKGDRIAKKVIDHCIEYWEWQLPIS